jgi:hypothetical protein
MHLGIVIRRPLLYLPDSLLCFSLFLFLSFDLSVLRWTSHGRFPLPLRTLRTLPSPSPSQREPRRRRVNLPSSVVNPIYGPRLCAC